MMREDRIKWWRDAKYGMFIHWGLYSVPCGNWKKSIQEEGYSEWVMFGEKIPAQEYALLADQFNPSQFDAKAWVDVAKRAGMKYIVFTTKHHDGFSMYDSDVTSYSVVKASPWRRDPTRELADACRAAGIRFGCYYSTDRDWYRPQGPGNKYKQTNVWDFPESTQKDFDDYVEGVVMTQVKELLVKYQPDLIWFDEIDAKSPQQIKNLHDLIRATSPACIINSRIKGCTFPEEIPPPNCDYISTGDNVILNREIEFEWENPGSMNTSFGYNKNDHNWVSPQDVIARLVDIVSKGGNYLLNVGPTADGIIPQPSVDNLQEAGQWLEINGEAVYDTSSWKYFGESPSKSNTDIRFTKNGDTVYAICLKWSPDNLLIKSFDKEKLATHSVKSVEVVGSQEEVSWNHNDDGLLLSLPGTIPSEHGLVYRIELEENR